jgi:hypothetical protein
MRTVKVGAFTWRNHPNRKYNLLQSSHTLRDEILRFAAPKRSFALGCAQPATPFPKQTAKFGIEPRTVN